MKTCSLVAAASTLGLALVLTPVTTAQATELQILAGGGMTAALRELGAQFESTSGHKLVFRFGTTPELIKMATAGAPFDLGIVPREVFEDAAAKAQFAPGTDVARVGFGVAVRSGSPKPNISTPDALKETLLKAQSVAFVPESAAGAQVLRLFVRLGIADEMKAKTKAQTGPAQIVHAVAKGDAELAVFLMSVLAAPGLDLVGPLPADLQEELVYTAAIAANTKQSEIAKAFIAYLMTPAAAAVLKARGMTPG
jgi:molybdate transport system substrate-binding protein